MTNKCTFEKLFINVPFIFLHHVANVILFHLLWPLGMKLLFSISRPPSSSKMHIQTLHTLCFIPQHLQTCLYSPLLYTKAQSPDESCSVFLGRPRQTRNRMCLLQNAAQPAVPQSFSAIIQVPRQATVSCHWLWKYHQELFHFFSFLLAWKDTVEAECLQLFTAWASCYFFRVCVFRATASILPVFLAPAHLQRVF